MHRLLFEACEVLHENIRLDLRKKGTACVSYTSKHAKTCTIIIIHKNVLSNSHQAGAAERVGGAIPLSPPRGGLSPPQIDTVPNCTSASNKIEIL